jgi:hypothetical protein
MRFAWSAALGGVLLGLTASGSAASSLGDWLADGTPVIDARARYEGVDDKSKTLFANAATLRLRLGYESAVWHGVAFAVDFDEVLDLGTTDHNSTRNGKTAYPTIPDPRMLALNRLQVSYTTDFDTRIIVGRQRLLIGDQRFIGNSGWRQHEQTFDAVTLVNTSVKDLTLTYAYLGRVNRVYGPSDPVPATGPAGHFGSSSHLFNAVYTGLPGLKLEGYAYLLKLGQEGPASAILATSKLSTATYGLRGEYRASLADGLTAQLNTAYAHQQNYAGNPLRFDLDYWQGEGSLSWRGLTALAGYEMLGGNGTIGFSTPLATLHAYQGWADLFLATPANGIDDLYLKGSYALRSIPCAQSLTATLVYHDFRAAHIDAGIGTEWDASLELALDKHTSFLLSLADYQGSGTSLGGFKDKTITWAQAAYKL